MNFALRVEMIIALAFVPISEVEESYQSLRTYLKNEGDEFDSILTYFEENYVSSSVRGRKTPARPQEACQVPDRIMEYGGKNSQFLA